MRAEIIGAQDLKERIIVAMGKDVERKKRTYI